MVAEQSFKNTFSQVFEENVDLDAENLTYGWVFQ